MELKSSEFADLIEVSQRQVNNYRKDGMPSIQKGSYHYYNLESIQWLYDTGVKSINLLDENDEIPKSPRDRKDLADAKNKEFDLDIKRKKYMLVEKAESNGANAAIAIRDNFLSLPDRLIPKLEAKETFEEIQHHFRVELKAEINRSLVKVTEELGD
jgi:phage terminase Nu1 subunit (DNA packaging protein)